MVTTHFKIVWWELIFDKKITHLLSMHDFSNKRFEIAVSIIISIKQDFVNIEATLKFNLCCGKHLFQIYPEKSPLCPKS